MTPVHEKKLFLLDAFALIYRAYYAFIKNPRINSQGQNTSAAFGFTTVLLDVLNKEKPTHIAVVFDSAEETHRAVEFEDYKANREAIPEDIASMIEPIQEIIRAFNIPVLISPGHEADDIIGTIAKQAEKRGFKTYMMTPDKDFGQLVSENIFVYKPAKGGKPVEILGVPEVCAQFEVDRPEQVIDVLGLWGDAVDNIPGIPGIGEKTAKALVKKYGSVEGLIAHADELKGKQKENVIQFAEQGLLSKKLATINLEVPVEFDEKALELEEPDKEKVKRVFTQLEFKTLGKRILGEEIAIPAQQIISGKTTEQGQLDLFGGPEMVTAAMEKKEVTGADVLTIANTNHHYKLITTFEERKELISQLLNQKSVCFDTETTDLDGVDAEIVGIAFSFEKNTGFYVAVAPNERREIVQEFKPFFEHEKIEKIAHNIKYDLKIIEKYDVAVKGQQFDTMIAHYLITPEGKHGMDYLSELYLNYQPVSIETLIGKKGKNQGSMADLDPSEISDYACEDADITFQLKQIFEPEIQKEHLNHLFYEIEMPLVAVLKDMEMEGIRLDVAALEKYSAELQKDLTELERKIKELAGVHDFNLDSPKQLGDILFEKLKIDVKAKKTKTGQYSTSEDTLSKLEAAHPIVGLILNYRSLRKLQGTYVNALPELVNKKTNRIHTSYMQTVTATGRLSSNNPNLQNIPIRTEKGREIRRAFIKRNEEYCIMSADYSQIELRIIAALADDKNMIEAFRSGHDIHAATAAKVFHVESIDKVTREQRSAAKAVNFGIIYGQSAFGLAQNLGISRTEAKEIIDSYWAQYGGIKQFLTNSVEFAREHGYVETIMKRRRYLADIQSANAIVRGFAERNAINAPIQGSAADIIKIAMIRIHREMKKQNLKSRMLLQVHDELVFDVHNSEKDVMEKLVRENMEHAVEMTVPLTVEYKFADNWLDAH
ncbi:MAG: DNA polymerase I [Crocinitomicaceae bacterium]|nr:DNA polymerase I [Crocinitomicaceae bacterium]